MVFKRKEYKKPEEKAVTTEAPKKPAPEPKKKLSTEEKLNTILKLLSEGCGDNSKYKALLDA